VFNRENGKGAGEEGEGQLTRREITKGFIISKTIKRESCWGQVQVLSYIFTLKIQTQVTSALGCALNSATRHFLQQRFSHSMHWMVARSKPHTTHTKVRSGRGHATCHSGRDDDDDRVGPNRIKKKNK